MLIDIYPCNGKFTDIEKQLKKITEEHREVRNAYHCGDMVNMAEELADLATCCVTLLAGIGADIPAVFKMVALKNKRRHYYG